jgi:hypothetical protein
MTHSSCASGNAQNASNGTRSLHVYTNAPYARIVVNGAVVESAVAVPAFGSAAFYNVPYAPGLITAQGLDGAGPAAHVLASESKASWGAPARILLTLDAPTPRTGTGVHEALYLDGELCQHMV